MCVCVCVGACVRGCVCVHYNTHNYLLQRRKKNLTFQERKFISKHVKLWASSLPHILFVTYKNRKSLCPTMALVVSNCCSISGNCCKNITGLPIGYNVIVALTGLPIGYSVIVAL